MSRLTDPPTEPTDQEHAMTSPTQRRHDELVALLTKIREESVSASDVLADMLDLLRERLPGRAEVKVAPFDPDLAARNLDAIKHELETPMRGHGECCDPAPADDGLAEWERELLRPATCCGVCPPIAGGGYDCTCEGNPRCEKADTPEEWHGNPAPADVDPDEALAKVIFKAFSGSSGREVDDTGPGWRAVARAAREHISRNQPVDASPLLEREREEQRERAERAEAERDEMKRRFNEVYQQAVANAEAADGWRAKHAAFRRDVENIRNGWRRRGRGHVKALTDTAADQVQGALNRDAAREPWGTVGDREAMLEALADAERRNGPLPTVDWETPEELSQKSIDSFIESRDPSDHPEQKPTDGKPSTVRQMPRRRTPQGDPDTVTLRRDDSDLEVEINSEKGKPSSCIVRHRGVTIFHGVSLDAIVTDRPLRAALGWGDEA